MPAVNSIIKRRPKIATPLLIGAIVILSMGLTHPASAALTAWVSSTSYPTGIRNPSCVVSSGFVYCIGGQTPSGSFTSAVNFAVLSPGGVGPWLPTTSYPTAIVAQSCVVSSGFVYCIGGVTPGGVVTSAVNFAALSPTGVGPWSSTTPYPTGIQSPSCVVSSGVVYCIGGITSGGSSTSAVNFAPLSAGGVGPWSPTTPYPINIVAQSCVVSSGFVYCIGGTMPGIVVTSAVNFALVSPSGVGPWSPTTAYPTPITDQSCVESSGVAYCIGGSPSPGSLTSDVNFTPLTPTGAGPWSPTTNYPTPIAEQSCVESSSFVYCIGGFLPGGLVTSAVFFAFVTPVTGVGTTTTVTCNATFLPDHKSTTCTATVSNTTPVPPSFSLPPTGTISWSCSPANCGFFTPPSCTLSSTGPNSASCSVTFTATPGKPTLVTITAAYTPADPFHAPSSGTTTLTGGSK